MLNQAVAASHTAAWPKVMHVISSTICIMSVRDIGVDNATRGHGADRGSIFLVMTDATILTIMMIISWQTCIRYCTSTADVQSKHTLQQMPEVQRNNCKHLDPFIVVGSPAPQDGTSASTTSNEIGCSIKALQMPPNGTFNAHFSVFWLTVAVWTPMLCS